MATAPRISLLKTERAIERSRRKTRAGTVSSPSLLQGVVCPAVPRASQPPYPKWTDMKDRETCQDRVVGQIRTGSEWRLLELLALRSILGVVDPVRVRVRRERVSSRVRVRSSLPGSGGLGGGGHGSMWACGWG